MTERRTPSGVASSRDAGHGVRRVLRGAAASCAALTVAVAVLGGYVEHRPGAGSPDPGRAALSGSTSAPAPTTGADTSSPTPSPAPTAPTTPAAPTAPASSPTTAPAEEVPPAQGGVVTSSPTGTIGVASYNVFGYRDEAGIAADLRALVGRDDVDVVGWQETDEIADLFPALDGQGWATRYFADGGRENAISWRRSEFALVGSRSVLVHRGAEAPETNDAFPDRYVTSVVLRQRSSGERLTVFNTHLNQYTENLADPGTWRSNLNAVRAKEHLAALAGLWRQADTRWVVGTGDFNFDYRADARVRPARGISRVLSGVAESSYEALGLRGVAPTHLSRRWIDYVLAGRAGLEAGHLTFRSQRSLAGYSSDHRPLLARVELA